MLSFQTPLGSWAGLSRKDSESLTWGQIWTRHRLRHTLA